jgi:hypothetical protein
MHGFTDCTFPSSRNAFSSSFLQRIGERDEPPTAGEADAEGPWHVEALPAGEGFGLFRAGESGERGFRPAVVFRQRPLALLAAAVLPGTGRDAAFRLHKEAGASGFAIEAGSGGEVVGRSGLFDEALIAALHVADGLARSPESLASFLEAVGQVALERAGAILDERVS